MSEGNDAEELKAAMKAYGSKMTEAEFSVFLSSGVGTMSPKMLADLRKAFGREPNERTFIVVNSVRVEGEAQ